MKKSISLLVLLCSCILVTAQNRLYISENFFEIDDDTRLILINQDIETLDVEYVGSLTIELSSRDYKLVSPVTQFELGIPYQVEDDSETVYTLYFTELPIVSVTSSDSIVDEPRRLAHFILRESNGNVVSHDIGVEYRGGWTQTLPKKSLRIEFWNDSEGDEKKDFSLLGMTSDDDWNIQAMYNEPLRLRSKFGFELWREIDQLHYQIEEPEAINGVRQEYVELFINQVYSGVYTISERITRKQLKLKKNDGDLIKGQLLKGVGWGASTYGLAPAFDNDSNLWSGFEYDYPDLIDWSSIHRFVDFVVNENDSAFYNNYAERIHMDNLVNYFIFLNLLRATDNTGKNIYVARYDTASPYYYVPWDLDGTLGIIWNGTQENITDGILVNGFYDRLMADDRAGGFLERLSDRWIELREEIITHDKLMGKLQTQFDYLDTNGVYERESIAWPSNEFFDYDNLSYTSDWLQRRLDFLDEQFVRNASDVEQHDKAISISLYPNPADKVLYIDSDDEKEVAASSVLSLLGEVIYTDGGNEYIDVSQFAEGCYFLLLRFNDGASHTLKFFVNRS